MLLHLGRPKDALDAYDRYLAKGKPLESVYRGRGLARAELGQYPGAIEEYTRALELQPTADVQAYRGWAHLVCEAPKLALRDFELAVKFDPKNADAYAGRGFVLAGQGKTREAAADAAEAVRLGPATPRLLYNAARIYAQCGAAHHRRAVDLVRQALEAVPAGERAAFWTTTVGKDPAVEAIRWQPAFRQLEADATRKEGHDPCRLPSSSGADAPAGPRGVG